MSDAAMHWREKEQDPIGRECTAEGDWHEVIGRIIELSRDNYPLMTMIIFKVQLTSYRLQLAMDCL